jgi:RNA polymerase sigma factor (sigma-70 family)
VSTPVGVGTEDLLRRLAPQVLGSLVRRYGHFDLAEDAVQEALIAAALHWPAQGVPENPRGWLATVAARRLTDGLRSEQARRRREEKAAAQVPPDERFEAPPVAERLAAEDDTLTLLFLSSHPSLTPASQLALTLRAVGGLTTAEIARAFMVPDATIAQRISRAKQTIKASDIPFELPPQPERAERLQVVLHVLYLIFNEGYTATSGADLQRSELTAEAIRLTREVRRLLPEDGEVAGLLALMLLTEARRAARTRPDGSLVPLEEQDRGLWNRSYIEEGLGLVTGALARGPLGPYQLQAAIAAVHDEAAHAEDTDWPQILALYELLEHISPNPMVTLNHAVAVAMVRGPQAGLDRLASLEGDPRVAEHHRLEAVGPTSWSWRVTRQPHERVTGRRPVARGAFQSSATSRVERLDSQSRSRARHSAESMSFRARGDQMKERRRWTKAEPALPARGVRHGDEGDRGAAARQLGDRWRRGCVHAARRTLPRRAPGARLPDARLARRRPGRRPRRPPPRLAQPRDV